MHQPRYVIIMPGRRGLERSMANSQDSLTLIGDKRLDRATSFTSVSDSVYELRRASAGQAGGMFFMILSDVLS